MNYLFMQIDSYTTPLQQPHNILSHGGGLHTPGLTPMSGGVVKLLYIYHFSLFIASLQIFNLFCLTLIFLFIKIK
jgi:hypothetical protein